MPAMHEFHDYLSKQLVEHLKKRRIVVWYDPKGEFRPYIRELTGGTEPDRCRLDEVRVGEVSTHLCEFKGSFFEVKFAVEPLVAQGETTPLLIYIPGIERKPLDSPLMELEKGGHLRERFPLKQQARFALRSHYTDGVIDGMLASENVQYEDVVGLLADQEGERSMLKVIFSKARDNGELIADWIAAPETDRTVFEKGARSELYALIGSRLGLELDDSADLATARTKSERYILLGEFRDGLQGEAPATASMIPSPDTKDQLRIIRDVTEALRQRHPEAYARIADRVEGELSLANQSIAPDALGCIDTFRFEERAVLKYAGQLICNRQFEKARKVIDEHQHSFWSNHDLCRQQQWQACRLMVEVGELANAIRKSLPPDDALPAQWIRSYAAEGGWYNLDSAERSLEALVAGMSDDPESEVALNGVRADYEKTIQAMTAGFVKSLQKVGWNIPEVTHQAQIYSKHVEGASGPVAYIVVDSLRFEMGAALRDQLNDAEELALQPAVASIPTITPVGMAALLPGASASFNVVAESGKLTALVDGSALADLADRVKYLKSRVPGSVEIELGKLLDMSAKQLQGKLAGASLIVVRSQDIDVFGESGSNRIARQVMDAAIGNIARAVRKLANAGVESFVVAADHGHLFTSARDESMRIESPAGETVELHRRCWIGRGGKTPSGALRVTGAELGYATDLEFVFPTGAGVIKSGGDLAYHHGGLSLQELVIPVLSVRMKTPQKTVRAESDIVLSGIPEVLTNRTFGITVLAASTLFGSGPVTVRPAVLSRGVQVGRAGMALDAGYDPKTNCVALTPGKAATIGMLLQGECKDKVRVVILDPKTDAVLKQSQDISVKLGI